jgi:hypothetical protein
MKCAVKGKRGVYELVGLCLLRHHRGQESTVERIQATCRLINWCQVSSPGTEKRMAGRHAPGELEGFQQDMTRTRC